MIPQNRYNIALKVAYVIIEHYDNVLFTNKPTIVLNVVVFKRFRVKHGKLKEFRL